MWHKILTTHANAFRWRHTVWTEEILSFLLAVLIFVTPASAAMRVQERSLYMNNATPGATSSYTLSFRYMSPTPIGSVELLFCMDPIPYRPCAKPAGMDVSKAILSKQKNDTGFSIATKTANRIVLTRSAIPPSGERASYTFKKITNPTVTNRAFSVRLKTFASTNATGPQVDFGSVRGQATTSIELQAQVPPMLIFCAAGQVEENCTSTNENYYTDMGELSPGSTLKAQSQMAVGTNASGGFAITANGIPMSAGTSVIDAPPNPTNSIPGTNQFGINLVKNSSPSIGSDPEGDWANAVASTDYGISNKYKYASGDVVAYSPNVSLMKKFTVSYIVNSRGDLRPGVYTTTITYIASGRF